MVTRHGRHLDQIGVLLSRLLQHGDTLEAIAAGMARLGDGTTPASIVGAVRDLLVNTRAGPETPSGIVGDGVKVP